MTRIFPVEMAHSSFTPVLRVAVTSRALFNLEAEDEVFRTQGLPAYKVLQRSLETQAPEWGTAYSLVRKLTGLRDAKTGVPLAEVVLVSRNDPITALRLARALDASELPIIRRCYTGGGATHPYLRAFGVNLFLSAHQEDVVAALAAGIPAAMVLQSRADRAEADESDNELRIGLDGDSTVFDGESDQFFRESGGDLAGFQAREQTLALKPMERGPMAPFLMALHRLQELGAPVRTAVITARCAPADQRAIRTLASWGIQVDEFHALGGRSKTPFLDAFRADLFCDDNPRITAESRDVVPTSWVITPSLAS